MKPKGLLSHLTLIVLLCAKEVRENSYQSNDNREENILPPDYSATNYQEATVNWNLQIKGILLLSSKDMEFGVDTLLNIDWIDNQLNMNNTFVLSSKILPKIVTDKLFLPFVKFTNCKACGRSIINPQEHSVRLLSKSIVLYSFRKKISFSCLFDLSRYPFDVQICTIDIMLIKFIFQDVNIPIEKEKLFYKNFDKDRLAMPSEFKLTQTEVVEIPCLDSEVEYEGYSTGFCFSYIFTFERTILQNILLIFLPSSLIVMLSWISFWLDVELAAPRVALGQTSLLTLAAQFHSVQNGLPPVSTVKAIDVWMFMCIFMAFASILEYALAYNCQRRFTQQSNKIEPYRYSKKEFGVDVELNTNWEDKQLKVNKTFDRFSTKILSRQIADKLFLPFLKFTNCKACSRLIIDPNEHCVRSLSNYIIVYTFRKKISFNCIFDLSRYPFDVQICRIDVMLIILYGQEIYLSIYKEKIFYANFDKKKLTLPSEFKLKRDVEVVEIDCVSSDFEEYSTGFCFSYIFTFERTILQNILLIFLPSSLVVILSWISFWLDVELAAPRVALGQTSLLALAAQFNSVQNNLPPVSTVKAIDIWMFMCIFMAFASILEYAIAYNCEKHWIQQRNKIGPYKNVQKLHQKNNKYCRRFRSIDFWAKIIFPLIFFIFNIVFWGTLFM
uniref:Neurotransmitter-gated ion-channel ligand-binding domain-containing protein n=1 Tax=Strigamia maritima TaxID=126957 RepID=T1JD88_STRMM